jgi:anti-anti-sigma factor
VTAHARLTAEWHEDIPVARIAGEIDASNTGEFAERLHALLSNRSTALIVDLTETIYIDSAGINLLFTLGDELRGRQQQLHLVVGEGTPIARMLAVTSLDRTHPAHASVAAALAAA